nr:MAG TPA: hypothetical protein [Caudoviricetes sp.]
MQQENLTKNKDKERRSRFVICKRTKAKNNTEQTTHRWKNLFL